MLLNKQKDFWKLMLLAQQPMNLVLPQPTVQYDRNSVVIEKCGNTAGQLSSLFGVPITPDLKSVADFIDLGGDYQEQTWNFQITLNEAQMKYLHIRYASTTSVLDYGALTASVIVPQQYTTQQVARQAWAGDLGKIFGKKKTVYDTQHIPRGLNPAELECVKNTLQAAITAHPNFVSGPTVCITL